MFSHVRASSQLRSQLCTSYVQGNLRWISARLLAVGKKLAVSRGKHAYFSGVFPPSLLCGHKMREVRHICELWSDGYFMASVGDKVTAAVIR